MQKGAEAEVQKDGSKADIAKDMPTLKEAIAALDKLNAGDITELKSLSKPPVAVKMVMEAICIMFDIKPDKINNPDKPGHKILDYWKPSKKLLGDWNFLSRLKGYDKDNIPPHIMAKIREEYISNPEFEPARVRKVSAAAQSMCKWVIAMETYDRVVKSSEKK